MPLINQSIYGHKNMDIKQWNAWYKLNKDIDMQRRPAIEYIDKQLYDLGDLIPRSKYLSVK